VPFLSSIQEGHGTNELRNFASNEFCGIVKLLLFSVFRLKDGEGDEEKAVFIEEIFCEEEKAASVSTS